MEESENNIVIQEKKQSKGMEIFKCIFIPVLCFGAWYIINFVIQFIFAMVFSAYAAVKYSSLSLESIESKAMDMIYQNISLMYLVIAVVFIGVFILLQKTTHFSKHVGLEFKKTKASMVTFSLLLGTFVGAFANLGLEIMSKYLPQSWVEGNEESVGAFQGGNVILMLIAVVICAPIAEELLFRGLVYNGLKKIFNLIPKISTRKSRIFSIIISAIISSALFGIYHGNILQALYTGLLSLFMIYVYEMSGSIITSMLVHCAFNFAGTPTYYIRLLLGDIPSIAISTVLAVVVLYFIYRICRIKTA